MEEIPVVESEAIVDVRSGLTCGWSGPLKIAAAQPQTLDSFDCSTDLGTQVVMNQHEEQFAREFIIPEKRDRYVSLIGSVKGRKKILAGFHHIHDLVSGES